MNNYMGDSIQYDNNMMTQPTTNLFNQPSNFPSNGMGQIGGQMGGQMGGMMGGMMGGQMPNNLSTQQFDPMLLNGTNLDDEPNYISGQTISPKQDSTLIKSVAREIINGLKENNMSLYDNSSINSYKINENELYNNNDGDSDNNSSSRKKSKSSKSKNKVVEVVETIEDFVTDAKKINSTNTYSDYPSWFFDDCFNYKDFLILFILYFVLSQDMIKDFFAKYFTSLNPDNEGKIGVQGVIIYGLILTILFMIIKKLF